MPDCEICYESFFKLKVLYACKHELCKMCYPRIIETATRLGNEICCPFCRTAIKEISEDYETEFWLNLCPNEWDVLSSITNNGTEIIRTRRKNEKPTWRNDDNVIIIKRNRQRKKYRKNRNLD